MSQIAIEGYPLDYIGAHVYLVYTDDLNREWLLRGGPEHQEFNAWGNIVTIPGNMLLADQNSPDKRLAGQTPADRWDTVLDLGGRRAEDVWSILSEQAANIGKAQLPYTVSFNPLTTTEISQTSNSVVASVLRTVGISVPNGLPSSYLYAGLGNFLTFDYNLTNGDHGGTLQGYLGNDTLIGGAGVDKLYGDDGNDTLRGGGGNDPIDGGTGVNTALYSGRPADHIWFKNAAGSWTIIDVRSGSPDGTDVLNNVQFLKFDAGDVIALSPTVAGQPVTLIDQTMAAQGDVTVVGLTHNTGPGTQTLYYNAPIASNGLVLTNINRTDFAFLSWDTAWATVFGYFDDGVHTLGIPQNGNFVGGLTNYHGTDTIQLIKQDKTAFSLKAIALDTFWAETGVVATFTGIKLDGSTVAKTFQLDSAHGLQNVSFDQTFTNLKAAYFTASDSVLFDNIAVDPSPPTAAITSVSPGGRTGRNMTGGAGAGLASVVTVSGIAIGNSIVTVFDAGTALGTTPVDPNGNWNFVASLPDGTHRFTASDTVGTNTSLLSSEVSITIGPNPTPPVGTTAVMLMNNPNSGTYEIYDVGGNAILAAYQLGQVATPWTFAALGTFEAGDISELLFPNRSSGA